MELKAIVVIKDRGERGQNKVIEGTRKEKGEKLSRDFQLNTNKNGILAIDIQKNGIPRDSMFVVSI